MHFPLPMPAFDVFCIDSPYDGIGSWQNRVFAVPPAMGIDYRCVNGYIYISGNAVTDPEKIAERAGVLPGARRPLLPELERPLREVAGEGRRDDPRADRARGARPARVRAARGRLRERPQPPLLRRARRVQPHAPARRPDVAAPQRVPAARLRRVHDLQRVLQGPPAGHPRPAHRADGRRHRRHPLEARRRAAPAGAPGDRLRRRRGVRRGPHAGGDRRGAGRERGGPGVAGGAGAGEGPLVQHGHGRRPLPLLRELVRRPVDPVRVADRPRRSAEGGRGHRAPDRAARARARPPRGGVRLAARRGARERASKNCSRSPAPCSPTSRSTSSSATTGS